MPFAMIPEGFKLQKVTKAQEKAVKDKRRHDDMVALLNNPTAATAIIAPIVAIATGAAGVALVDLIVGLLKKEGATITEKAVEQTKQSVKGVVGAVQTTASVAQEIAETGRIGQSVGAPLAIDVEDIPEIIYRETLKKLGFKVE